MNTQKTDTEVVYFDDKLNPTVPGKEVFERNVAHVIVIDKKSDAVLVLEWPEFSWKTFVIGGIEGGENPSVAAQREVAEETGYFNIKLIAEVGKTRSSFYAAHKGVNRIANATAFLFELVGSEQKPVNPEETKNHNYKWIPIAEVAGFINIESQKYIWQKALEKLA